MRVFLTRGFDRFASKENIADKALLQAIGRAAKGLIDGDLGGNVIKQRVARQGEGRSGGYRTIIVFREGDRAFFVYGFAKSALDNISSTQLRAFRELAKALLGQSEAVLENEILDGSLREIIK